MKKTNRAIALAVLIALLVTSLVTLVACGGAKDALEGYQLSVTSVKDDFVLPRVIGEKTKVKWKSDNDAIEIVKRRGEDYLAKVTLGDTTQKVTLTVSASGAGSKDFTVNVQALNAMLMANEYAFPQEGLEVSESFDLDQTFENRGKTANITWSVDDQYKDYINVVETKCVVTVPPETTKVEIKGTFSYNNSEATKPFTFYVAQPKTHREEVNDWYARTNVTMGISGYVTGIASEFAEKYTNMSLYIVDDDFCSGYYLYQTGCSAADAADLKIGSHVTVTGAKSTDYNGLWETTGSSASSFVLDRDIAAKTPEELIYNLDNDVTSGSPALKWHTGALVKLSNWTVDKVEATSTDKAATLLTLKKDDTTIAVAYNNYMVGYYTDAAAIKTKAATFKVGDTVTVTGILNYNKGFQVLPRSADDIVAGTADTTATPGSKVKAAIAAVNDAVKAAGVSEFITSKIENKDLPTEKDGVTITYTECFDVESVSIANGKLNVTPQAKLQNTTVEVEYSIDGYKTWTYFSLRSQALDDAGKVAYVKEHLDVKTKSYEKNGEETLPKASDFSFEGLTIEWKIKEAEVTYATIVAGKLTVKLPEEAGKFTLVATIKVGDKQDTLEFEITVAAAPKTVAVFEALTEAKAGTYKLHLYQEGLKADLYATGAMSGYYYGTTEDATAAADFVIAAVDGGYTIKTGDKFAEIVPRTDGSEGINVVFNATQTAGKVWKWNDTIKTFTMKSGNNNAAAGETEYFLGTSGTFNTFSANKVADAASKYVGQFGTVTIRTIGEIIANEEAKVGDFYLGLYQANLNKWLYATGAIVTNNSGNFGGTTEKPAEAALFTIAGTAADGYTIKVGGKFLELDSGHKFALVDSSTQKWKWNAEAKVFTFEVSDVAYYLGTYNSFNTISASEITRITGEKASDVGVSQFPAYFGTIYGYDRAADHKHDWEYNWVDDTRTHTKRCKVAGCPFGTAETEACAIEDNVCDLCKHTYPAGAPAHITNKSVADLATTPPTDSMLVIYEVVGIWHPTGAASDQYGNGYLYDPSTGKRIQIYGMADTEAAFAYESGLYKFTNPKKFQDIKSNFNAGDEIKLGVAYNSTYSNYYAYFIQKTDSSSSFHAYTASVTCEPAEGQGTATLDKTDNLSYDDEVTVTVSPASGYKVKSVVANGASLNEVEANTYKFKAMPGVNAVVVTFEVDDGEREIVIDFTKKETNSTVGSKTWTSTSDPGDVTIDSLLYKFWNCKQDSSYTYMMFNKNGSGDTAAQGAYFANSTPVPGNITKIEVTIPSGASGSATYYVNLFTAVKLSLLTSTDGGTPTTGKDTTITVTAQASAGFSYFNITKTASTYNGQVSKIVITYVPTAA